MTGDLSRKINLGVDTNHFKETGEYRIRSYSFNHFQFPACTTCNSEFSELEGRVKQYVIRIFEKDYFTNFEIDDLLDWFDKVRIGLWLGYVILDKTIEDVLPKFHIKKRIGNRDRCLFIYELEDDGKKGIQFVGCNSPGFQFVPSCFALRINNIYFFNYSFDFLFAKNIGFPYPKQFANTDTEKRFYVTELFKGLEKISQPLIPFKFLKAANYIYQPIIPKEVHGTMLQQEFYDTAYIFDNTMDLHIGKGDVFYFDKKLNKLGVDSELQLYTGTQGLSQTEFPRLIVKQTLEVLESLLQIKPQDHLLSDEQRKVLKINRSNILKWHRNFMRHL